MLTISSSYYCQLQQQFPSDFRSLLSERDLIHLTLAGQTLVQFDSEHQTAPQNLLTLLSYAYLTGRFSTENLIQDFDNDSVFRYICVNNYPVSKTIRSFRRHFRPIIIHCIAQILSLCMDKLKTKSTVCARSCLEYRPSKLDQPSFQLLMAEAESRINLAAHLDCMAMDD